MGIKNGVPPDKYIMESYARELFKAQDNVSDE